MKKKSSRKAIIVLKKFPKSQIDKFHKYLNCDLFPSNDKCIQLFDLLKEHHPRYLKFDNQLVINHLFPNTIGSEKKLNYVFKNLYNKILDYIALEEFLSQKELKQKMLLNYFNRNHLDQQFEDAVFSYGVMLQKNPIRNSNFYSEQMKLGAEIYFYPDYNKFKRENKKGKQPFRKLREILKDSPLDLFQTSKNLETSFLLNRFRFSLELIQRTRIINEPNPSIPLLKESISLTIENDYYQNPILQIFVSLIQFALGEKSGSSLTSLIDIFFKNTKLLSPHERRELFQFFLNEMTFRSRNHGKRFPIQHQLDFYRRGKKENCFVVDGRIHDIFFTNIIMLFCKNSNFNFANQIVKDYQKYLHPDLKLEVLRFSQACIFFYQGKFKKAENLLFKDSKFTQLNLEHRARTFLLCCQYELASKDDTNSIGVLHTLIDNFKKYYERKEDLAKNKKLPYLNLVKMLKQIIAFAPKKNKNKEKNKLLNTVHSLNYVAAKDWLIKHIKGL